MHPVCLYGASRLSVWCIQVICMVHPDYLNGRYGRAPCALAVVADDDRERGWCLLNQFISINLFQPSQLSQSENR